MFFIKDKKKFIEKLVFSYLIFGLYFIIISTTFPSAYIHLILFFSFKMIFDYRKCTISYLECKLRNVKKENGYLNYFMDGIVDLRYHKDYNLLIILFFIYILYDIYTKYLSTTT